MSELKQQYDGRFQWLQVPRVALIQDVGLEVHKVFDN